MNNDIFKEENGDKKGSIDVFYREKPPSLKTLRKIKEILNKYDREYNIRYLLTTDVNNTDIMKKYHLIDAHFPFAIVINGEYSAKIDDRIIYFIDFPILMAGIGRYEGNWTLSELDLVLKNKSLLFKENYTPIRNLEHRINWKDAWKAMRNERKRKPKITYENDFFEKLAYQFSHRHKLNNYEYGRNATDILNEILNDNLDVLEIGPGSGALTIPLSKKVKYIVGIDISETNIDHIKANLNENEINNVKIINENWETVNDDDIEDRYDLVVCSHFLWQIDDIEVLLKKMEKASKKYCAIIQPCGRNELVKEIFEEICNQKYTGQFEPDADYFAFVILREWGRLVNIKYFNYTYVRGLEYTTIYMASFIGRFVEVNQEVIKKIDKYLLKKLKNDIFRENNNAVVMWWEVK